MAMRRPLAMLLSLVLAFGFAVAAEGREVIARFDVLIEVQSDGIIDVTETIEIIVEGVAVKRGIEREIPLRRADGRRAGFELIEVKRGGVVEPHTMRLEGDRALIRIGRADRFLPSPSEQTYTIRYRSEGQLRGFADFDELYWNVTGDESPFAIVASSVVIRLPDGVELLQAAGYTGPPGDQGTAFRVIERAGGRFAAETSAVLQPGQGFTVAVGWSKGAIGGVIEAGSFLSILRLPALFVTLSAALAGSALVLLGLRRTLGRGPAPGIFVPQFTAPSGLSPAACRFLATRRVDDRSLTACLIGLASKGALKIFDQGSSPRFTLMPTGPGEGLNDNEQLVRWALFETSDEAIVLGARDDRIVDARRDLRSAVEARHLPVSFMEQRQIMWIGVSLIFALVGLAFVVANRALPEAASWYLVVVLGTAAFAAFPTRQILFADSSLGTICARSFLAGYPELLVVLLLGGPVLALSGLLYAIDLPMQDDIVEIGISLCFGLLFAVLIVLFCDLLVVPTPFGRQQLDTIEGLALYLSVAEADRLEMLHPPERTAEHFEELLPYAIALGHVGSWTQQFARALGSTRPEWYESLASEHDDNWDWLDSGMLEREVRSTKRMPPPPSDDNSDHWGFGSSGGGASGGGGGGGGTRGW